MAQELSEVIIINDFYSAKYEENCKNKCAINFNKRILALSDDPELCSKSIFDQWQVIGGYINGEYKFIDRNFDISIIKALIGEQKTLCLCGQAIKNIFLCSNVVNGNKIRSGCNCVGKIPGSEDYGVNVKIKNFKKIIKDSEVYRKCVTCNQYNINKEKPEWSKECRECYKKSKKEQLFYEYKKYF